MNDEMKNFLNHFKIANAPQNLNELLKQGEIRCYKKKEVIYHEGNKGHKIHFLLKGIVRLYRSSRNGQQRILMFVRPGEIYGNIPLTDGLEHTVTAEVFEQVTDLSISNEVVKEFIKRKPDVLWYLAADLTKKLRITNQAIEESYLTAEQRIIRAIKLIVERFGFQTESGIELRLNFTHEDLAKFSGTTRVTVVNVVSSLVDKGIISTKPKPWMIRDIPLFEKLFK